MERPPPAGAGERVDSIITSAPGRICLFGEHQDYLNLPVIAMAIDLRLHVEGEVANGRGLVVFLDDLGRVERFDPGAGEVTVPGEEWFLSTVVNRLLREGVALPGVRARVHSEIPVNSGTSSSTALTLAWMQFLLAAAGEEADPARLAEWGFLAEVADGGGSGGRMDHVTIAHGGILAIRFVPELRVRPLRLDPGSFVLGDSGEPKDTQGILSSIRGALEGVDRALRGEGSSLRELRLDEIGELTDGRRELRELLAGTLETRELTGEALEVLGAERFDPRELGRLLNEHQAILGRRLKVSTEKIDRMLRAAMEAGALGGKLNGSGGGGCMFAYAPEDPRRVARAIEEVGGRAYVIHQDQGVHLLAASGVRRDGAV